ncbi:MAG: DUF3800 domain-containing protein [Anaerolineae bacterium]|nr:DUF3800 domain-containing protein [Anaerolineae bacterium]
MVSHVAYGDEAYKDAERYRSVAIVTLAAQNASEYAGAIRGILDDSGIRKEFKWSNLRQARERFAAIKIADWVITRACAQQIRVDVLVWDTYDDRHDVQGRDDIANLQRMYFHLFRNVLANRWPIKSTWKLYPDENSAIDWRELSQYLDTAGVHLILEGSLRDWNSIKLKWFHDFRILNVEQVHSENAPICQVADLFAGVAVYSRTHYDLYTQWVECQSLQQRLPIISGVEDRRFSGRDKERCIFLDHLNKQCKKNKLGVSLKTKRGLTTFNPSNPINFWLYVPQHEEDVAPIRSDA